MASRNVGRDSWDFCRPLRDHFFWRRFARQSVNCCLVASFVAFIAGNLLTAHFYRKDQELENIKKFLQVMEVQTLLGEVDRAEKACMVVASDVRYLHQGCMNSIGTETDTTPFVCHKVDDSTKLSEHFSGIYRLVIPKNTSSSKEVTILSFIYTTSFDKEKKDPKNSTYEISKVT